MNQYSKGETVRLRATFKDENGTLVDPDSANIAVEDASGKVVVTDSTTMTKSATGIYVYNFDSNAASVLGVCVSDAILVKGGFTVRVRESFEIVEAVG